MGGLLAPRAAALQHRLAAVIAMDGVNDMGQTVRAGAGDIPDLKQRLRADADPELDAQIARQMAASPSMRWEMELGQYAFGAPSPPQACAAFLDYHLRDGIAEKIMCPALICDAPSDLFFTGQARQLYDHLTCSKTFLQFADDEGADAHWPWPESTTGWTTPWAPQHSSRTPAMRSLSSSARGSTRLPPGYLSRRPGSARTSSSRARLAASSGLRSFGSASRPPSSPHASTSSASAIASRRASSKRTRLSIAAIAANPDSATSLIRPGCSAWYGPGRVFGHMAGIPKSRR